MKRRASRGQSLVETTLILAAFMLLLLGIVTVGVMLFSRQTLAERAHEAARWGAVKAYDPAVMRDLVLYGSAEPESSTQRFLGLAPEDITVANQGCPGAECRVSVGVPKQGVWSVEPVECAGATCDVPSRP